MAWSTPPTFAAGATLTAAQLNILGGDLSVLGSAWTVDARASTVIWTANTSAPALGNGTLVSRYRLAGKTLDWEVLITMGSTTTFGTGQWKLVPPATPFTTGGEYAVGAIFDTSSGNRYAAYAIRNAGSFDLQVSLTAGALTSVDNSTPMAWGTGDKLAFLHTCEVV